MAYGVILLLTPNGDRPVRTLWTQLAQAGLSSPMIDKHIDPHLTLGLCTDINPKSFEAALTTFTRLHSSFALELSHIGLFTDPAHVLFLGITMTDQLLRAHNTFDLLFSKYAIGISPLYRPNRWVPHLTLAERIKPEEIPRAMGWATHIRLPFHSVADRIALVDTVTHQTIFTLPFS